MAGMEQPILPSEERGVDGLEPDLMLPEQFFGTLRGPSRTSGERRLMAAVLQEGIETLQKNVHASDPEGRESFLDALAWLRARHDVALFSFTTVCAALDIDADFLRGGVMRWLETKAGEKRPAAHAEATVEEPEPMRRYG